ncbi:hypothetical protein GS415_06595 [Rhodococcus hoagii]|nr:hypothetical protein [Prescottella equi]
MTESTAYTRFGTDNNARKQYLQNIAGKVVERMTARSPSRKPCWKLLTGCE